MTAKPARRAGLAATLARQDWLFAVALATFVGIAVWFGRSVVDFLAPSSILIATPSFVGQTEADALAQAERQRLRAIVIARTPSDRFPKGVVMGQDPASGSQVRPGRQISLIVSAGVEIFPMPDLRYESMREVQLDLAHYRLTLGKSTTVNDDTVPADHVVTQDPPPLASVRVGTPVNLTLSAGAPPGVRAPNFVNLSIDEARDAARAARVQLGQVVWTPFGLYGPARGVVVREKPAAGTILGPGEQVSLQVSAGPLESGYIIRQVHALASVPANVDLAKVRIQVRDDTGTWTVFDGYARGRQKFAFNLTVVGTSELDMYVGDSLVGSTTLGVEPPLAERQQARQRPPGSAVKPGGTAKARRP